VENQPSSSLISLSPLTSSLPRALRRAQVRPLGSYPRSLLLVRSLDFGCNYATIHCSRNRLADPLYKRYAVVNTSHGLIIETLERISFKFSESGRPLSDFLHSTHLLSLTLHDTHWSSILRIQTIAFDILSYYGYVTTRRRDPPPYS